MKQSASHKTLTPMMSILLILSMVVSVFFAASMPLMNSKSNAEFSAVTHYSLYSANMPEKCPASKDSTVDHCVTCAFISNMVGIAPSILASTEVGQKENYPLHRGRLKGIPDNVDLSPPQIS